MLFYLIDNLADEFSVLNAFRYLTLRAIMSVLTALTISLLVGPVMIRKLKHYQIGQSVRDDGPSTHLDKHGTPTMGGALIIVSISIATLLWADLSNRFVWVSLLTLLGFGAIGWVDDYKKVVHNDPKGISARQKMFWQSVFGLTAVVVLYATAKTPGETQLIVPFFKGIAVNLGLLYIVLGYFVIVGTSNAVNLTDGLDGLAILPTVLVAGALGIFAYVVGNSIYSGYLGFPFIKGAGELLIICGAVMGSGLGFLWFNTYPAQVFMGDVGALALGALLGVIAIVVRQEIVLFIMGGVFVVEAISVMIQVGSFKTRGKRVFKMAPLHHHFELKGWPEPRVIVRFWIVSLILVLIGLATLKLR